MTGGSSPLTRGKPRVTPTREGSSGLIPAHAGKTLVKAEYRRPPAAHPRSRGENGHATHVLKGDNGSSPLTRGKLSLVVWGGVVRRLIPAHAGKTRGSPSPSDRGWAHPRSRGENRPMTSMLSDRFGSSPLTRGKRRHHQRRACLAGLIPAHAGKTACPSCSRPVSWAHPRSRGENAHASCARVVIDGSSPLTRGKHTRLQPPPHARGLIPAHAGKTIRPAPPPYRSPAHPRSRGENVEDARFALCDGGSSPLTRGKLKFRH